MQLPRDPRDPSQSTDNLCARCKKPKAAAAGTGSITSYIFQGANCICSLDGGDAEFCPRCGLMLTGAERQGSITSYLFQDIRCKCKADPNFMPGSMTQKLRSLKQRESGSTFGGSSDDAKKTATINLLAGAMVGGSYRIKRQIGTGGMGEVYLADHLSLGREVALKVIPPEQVQEMSWLRFQQEARILSRLRHKNIIQVTDLGIHEACLPYCAMEFFPGRNLSELLKQNGPMSLSKSIEIFKQVADAIEHAHQHGIIHRDIKPANIMLLPDGDGNRTSVKVLDFGIARLRKTDQDRQSMTSAGDIFGSPFYMSPEQCTGTRIDHRTDFYSIGCTMFECLTGKPPFSGTTAEVVQKHLEQTPPELSKATARAGIAPLPESMELVMAKLLRKNPVERYQSAAEFKSDLERMERNEPIQPFYARRSKQQSKENEPVEKKPAESRPRRKYLVAGLVLGTIIAGSTTLIVQTTLKKKAALKISGAKGSEAAKSDENAISKAKPINDIWNNKGGFKLTKEENAAVLASIKFDGKPFLQEETNEDGAPIKKYKFPIVYDQKIFDEGLQIRVNEGMGVFYVRRLGQSLIGEKTIAINDKVEDCYYRPNEFALNQPQFLQGFGKRDFNGLIFNFPAGYDTKLLSQFPPSFFRISPLKKIQIETPPNGPEAAAQKFTVDFVNRFSSPQILWLDQYLDLDNCNKLRCLTQIDSFRCNNLKSAGTFVKALERSAHLNTLEICSTPLKDEDYQSISKITNLQYLSLLFKPSQKAITPEQLQTICQLKYLTTLTTSNLPYSPEVISILKEAKSLRGLQFDSDSNWSAYRQFLLKKSLPGCKVLVMVTGQNSDPELQPWAPSETF